MNTQSHAILTFFLVRWGLGRRAKRLKHLNAVLFAGALFPDLPLYVFFLWHTVVKPTPQRVIWGELYYRADWQELVSAFHSFPVWATLLGLCLILKRPRAALFSLAALISAAEDFLLHHDDAHAHFWPLSDYRFASPVSYWDPAHHGGAATVVELVLVLAASVWTYRRLQTGWGKALLVLAVASLLLTHGLWSFIFGMY